MTQKTKEVLPGFFVGDTVILKEETDLTKKRNIKLLCRIDTIKELDYYKQGGILQYVLNSIIKKAS